MGKQRRKEIPGDDGRTIAPMNLEGMPWYREAPPVKKNPRAEVMSRRQILRYTCYAVLAGLAIVAVFGVVSALFIQFCTNVWFK